MIASSDIERMSVEERLRAIEQLWDSLPRQGDAIPSSAWHGEILAARRTKVEAGEGEFLSISELRARLKRGS